MLCLYHPIKGEDYSTLCYIYQWIKSSKVQEGTKKQGVMMVMVEEKAAGDKLGVLIDNFTMKRKPRNQQ